jgi:hypothetical protein
VGERSGASDLLEIGLGPAPIGANLHWKEGSLCSGLVIRNDQSHSNPNGQSARLLVVACLRKEKRRGEERRGEVGE